MPRTPSDAVAWASVPRSGYGGMCLQFVRNAYDVGSYYSCARDAWTNAAYQHPLSGSNLSGVPYGAPLFMDKSTSTYGHVAVYAGNGQMCTTDSQSTYTRVDSVQSWLNAGYHLLGWTEDLNGVRVLNTGDSGKDDEDMPLNDADKKWIEDTVRGLVRDQVLQVLRAPEFVLPVANRKTQIQSWVPSEQWITDTVRGLVRDQVLQVLRAPEFLLTVKGREGQTEEWVLAAQVSDESGTLQDTLRQTYTAATETQRTLEEALSHLGRVDE